MSRMWGAVVGVVGLLLFAEWAPPTTGAYVKARAGGGGVVAQDRYTTRRPVTQGAFEVEVLVNGYPLDALYGRGRRYVEAVAGEEYELRVRNPLPVRVAVALSVDGLNTIDARHTASWDASKWVIEPYGTIRVGGWQMSSARARRFYFTTERDSYAARLGRKSDLGVITAVFYREREYHTGPVPVTPRPRRDGEWEESRNESRKSAPPAQGESAGRSSAQDRSAAPMRRGDDDYAATGIGRSVEHHVNWINMELVRQPAAELSIRYEYRDALFKLGVLPRPRPDDNALRRRERSRGFEDGRYSPEP
jgi:hypothetical protein